MTFATAHREDIKASLRKKFGSLTAFERVHGLPDRSVSDVLRGKPSKRVQQFIERALSEANNQSDKSDCSGNETGMHYPKAKAL